VRSAWDGRLSMPDWLSDVVPDWLAEVLRPKKTPVPWGTMARAVFAIWVPLAAGFITGHREIGLLPAMGGLMSIMIDNGGTFRVRVRRVGSAAVFGGAAGLTIGSVIHGRGWVAVVAVVVVAGISALLSRLGAVGSVTGLQLLVYSSLGLGPIGQLRPWWHTALEFVAGVAWALLLIVPGWALAPRATEQRLVADVYHSLAAALRSVGTPGAAAARNGVTAALNAAYDALLTRRSRSGGQSRWLISLMAILNVSHQMAEASAALRHEGERPPAWVSDTIDRLADAIAEGKRGPLPAIPPPWSASAGALALRDSMVALSRAISRGAPPAGPAERRLDLAAHVRGLAGRVRAGAAYLVPPLLGGRIQWIFTIRLMVCMGVAAVISEVLPLTRSYWVVLTVAIILKPDYGSVFARALQRAIGTIVGAVLGAAILAVVPYGPWLLVPFGVLAALLPYGKAQNFGLSATFLTPFVVLLIDLLEHAGWRLAADRTIDTVLGSVIVLLIGYAVWPVSWQAHLPGQFAGTLRVTSDYIDEALVNDWADGQRPARAPGTGAADPVGEAMRPSRTARLRRQAFRSLSDLRAEFQRTMSEPARISRRATAWWPAVVALEEMLDAVSTMHLAIAAGAPPPDPKAVHELTGTLRGVADAIEAGLPPQGRPLPADADLRPVTDAARSVLDIVAPSPSLEAHVE
jgi:uncharacterized membrane protein YccC